MDNKVISDKEYKRIIKQLPIPCVDLVIVHKNEFLLGKRVNQPARGQWFFPGGRIYKGETILRAAIRKAKEEIGIKLTESDLSLLGVGETIFNGGNIDDARHSVNVVFLAKIKNILKFNFDKRQHSEIKWFSKIDTSWHPYVKEFLRKAGFK
jgi:colanic acid biosynthesis protein WcaH